MKKSLFALIATVASLAPAGLQAAPVGRERAMEIASEFASGKHNSPMRQIPGKAVSLTAAYTHVDRKSGQEAFHVFNRGVGDGFVMVAADDRAPLILGYADKGSFNPDAIPVSMAGMIESWGRQVSWLVSHPMTRTIMPKAPVTAVEPLLGEITWDQNYPYNVKCPEVTQVNSWGVVTGTGPAATGCVATGMGQIIYYHKWPAQGYGSVSYLSQGTDPDGKIEEVNVDVTLEGTAYNWDKMVPKLNSSSGDEAIDAVSTLLFHAGAAFHSVYGYASGAYDIDIPAAMINHFDYDKGINYVRRDFYSTAEWFDMLTGELAASRPVGYGAVNGSGGGHFFVIDGINTEGYVHVNWGWSGDNNGYFLLTLLDPTPGSWYDTAFHYDQDMITGIRRPVEGSARCYNFSAESIDAVDMTVDRNASVSLKANSLFNDSPNDMTANLGFALFNSAGEAVYTQIVNPAEAYASGYGENSIECKFTIPAEIAPGTYTAAPYYQMIGVENQSEVRQMRFFRGNANHWDVSVTADKITYATGNSFKLSILEVSGDNGTLESNVTESITLKVRNEGEEFFGPVQLRLFIDGKESTLGNYKYPGRVDDAPWHTFAKGETREITFPTGKFELSGSTNYVVALYGNRGMLGDEGMPDTKMSALCRISGVTLIGPAIPPKVRVTTNMILTSQQNNAVPRNDIRLKVCLDNDGGEWTGSLRAMVRQEIDWDDVTLGYINFKPVTIEGDTKDQWIDLVSIDELPAECETGEEYEIALLTIGTDTDEIMSRTKYAKITFEAGDAIDKTVKMELTDATNVPQTVDTDMDETFVFGVKNNGSYFDGDLHFDIMSGDTKVFESKPVHVALDTQEETTLNWTEKLGIAASDNYTLRLVAQDGTVIATTPLSVIKVIRLELTDATVVPQQANSDKEETFTFGVRNNGSLFEGDLHFDIMDNQTQAFESDAIHLVLNAGEETDISWTRKLGIPASDNYTLRLLAHDGSVIATIPITVIESTKLELTEATSIPQTTDPTEEENFIFGVRNLGSHFDGEIHFDIMDNTTPAFGSQPIRVTIDRNEETVVKWTEKLGIADKDSYTLRLLTDDGTEIATLPLIVRTNSGLSITGADSNANVRYFNLQGLEILTPAPGQTVIMVEGTQASKIIFNLK